MWVDELGNYGSRSGEKERCLTLASGNGEKGILRSTPGLIMRKLRLFIARGKTRERAS